MLVGLAEGLCGGILCSLGKEGKCLAREEPILDTLSHIQYGKRCNEALRIAKLDTGLVRIKLAHSNHLMGIHSDCAQGKF